MNKEENVRKRNIVSAIAATACVIVLCSFYAALVMDDLSSERERYSYIARDEAEHIVTTIDCVMARTATLKALIQDHGGDTSFFNDVAGSIYNDVIDETGIVLKNFALAPDGVVSDVYPLKGNESLIGFDFLDTSHPGNAEAKEAYEKGITVLTNPFELIQGGVGMGCRSPIILTDGDDEELWGLVTVTFDYDNLIDVLRLDYLKGMGVNYTLSYIDDEGNNHIMQAEGTLDAHPEITQFKIRNLTWELAVSPKKGWVSAFQHAIATGVILIISGLAGMFTNVLLKLREKNAILFQLSNTDQLTGGLNRMAFGTALSELASGPIDDDLVYVSVDLNGLKQANDTFGHFAGDELIEGANKCLHEAFEEYGRVYRIGGDEFAAFLHTEADLINGIVDKLHALTKEWKGDNVKELSLSVGYASHHEFPEATVETLIRIADKRMYDAKREYYMTTGADRRSYG